MKYNIICFQEDRWVSGEGFISSSRMKTYSGFDMKSSARFKYSFLPTHSMRPSSKSGISLFVRYFIIRPEKRIQAFFKNETSSMRFRLRHPSIFWKKRRRFVGRHPIGDRFNRNSERRPRDLPRSSSFFKLAYTGFFQGFHH